MPLSESTTTSTTAAGTTPAVSTTVAPTALRPAPDAPQPALMPTLAATSARRGSPVVAFGLGLAALTVLAVYIGIPLVHAARFLTGGLAAAAALALVVAVAFAALVVRILHGTHHPALPTSGRRRGARRTAGTGGGAATRTLAAEADRAVRLDAVGPEGR
ncbi:hypothetical protein [Cellulomonas marina]|uniref:Uncharacterized protein n=1 Tax=Cellulomonas marina TaxID=988821 RepID=A0A1I0X195_9CELL|nr:hypothetical protein [Cellulomonas marina]GIG29378.1 hypothetical protein Cma02nite_19780 [Cellulomonas marina]SFA94782.1 hypothetical protein SAMN05421867_10453 [Cellulomonas marina]